MYNILCFIGLFIKTYETSAPKKACLSQILSLKNIRKHEKQSPSAAGQHVKDPVFRIEYCFMSEAGPTFITG